MEENDWTQEEFFSAVFLLYYASVEERANYQKIWEDFEKEVINRNRFFAQSAILKEIEKYQEVATYNYKAGHEFYRARIFDKDPNVKFIDNFKKVLKEDGEDFDSFKDKFSDNEMLNFNISLLNMVKLDFSSEDPYLRTALKALKKYKSSNFKGFNKTDSMPPTSDKCTAGRANPEFIRYLYLCEDEATPVYEIKPSIKQNVSLAKLKLKRDVKVYDMTLPYTISGDEIVGFFQFIGEKFSMPNYNDLSKYIPTQMIAEKIKSLGFDGIRFNSSLNEGGKNIVLFNVDDCEVISTSLIQVTNIKITTDTPGIYKKFEQDDNTRDSKIEIGNQDELKDQSRR